MVSGTPVMVQLRDFRVVGIDIRIRVLALLEPAGCFISTFDYREWLFGRTSQMLPVRKIIKTPNTDTTVIAALDGGMLPLRGKGTVKLLVHTEVVN